MPLLHDPDRPDQAFESPDSNESAINMRRPMEENILTELCDGPLFEDTVRHLSPSEKNLQSKATDRIETSDRGELIERIKRGESPTWVPTRAVSAFSLYITVDNSLLCFKSILLCFWLLA